ncbi:MAG: DUF2092 domain-containing protein [Chlorobia bacterium]|nr:DUF2092 domain-containing protein [Fimbriimonadaceae bacterium]
MLLILGQVPSSESILKRYDQFLARANSLSMVVKSKFNGREMGTAKLVIARPNRMSITVKFGIHEASFVLNQEEGLEIDRPNSMYSEHPAFGQLYLPDFNLIPMIRHAVPTSAIRGTSMGMIPPTSKPTVATKVVVNGVVTDQISLKQKDQMSDLDIKIWIDATGRMVKFYSRVASMQGTVQVEQDISAYVVNPKVPDAVFNTRRPLGFSPYELARADYALPQGEAVPNVQLKAADSGKAESLKNLIAGKNSLVLIADPDFPGNSALFKALREVSMKIPDFKLVVLSNRRDPGSAKRIGVSNAFYDPTGKELLKLAIPGAPTMLLINKKGVLAQAFFGFDGQWEGLDKAVDLLKKGG